MRFFLVFISFLFFACHSIYAQCDTVKVEAQKGEGVYALLRRMGFDAGYYDEFVLTNRDNMGKDNSLIAGKIYRLPCVPVETISLDEETETSSKLRDTADIIVDSLLFGAVYYLISGHGGPDPGAVSYVDGNMICEDEYAYDISLRLKYQIEQHGGKVYMIVTDPDDSIRNDRFLKHDTDELCYPNLEIPRDQNKRLQQRIDAINALYDSIGAATHQRVVEIHLDSRPDSKNLDVYFYHHTSSMKGKKLAEIMLETFKAKYKEHQPNRVYNGTVTPRSLMVLRKTKPVGVFMELGNIANARDQKRFLNHNNREALAKWICAGLITEFEYYKCEKIE